MSKLTAESSVAGWVDMTLFRLGRAATLLATFTVFLGRATTFGICCRGTAALGFGRTFSAVDTSATTRVFLGTATSTSLASI